MKKLLLTGADPAYVGHKSALTAAAGSGSLECVMAVLEALGHWKRWQAREPFALDDATA